METNLNQVVLNHYKQVLIRFSLLLDKVLEILSHLFKSQHQPRSTKLHQYQIIIQNKPLSKQTTTFLEEI